MFSEIFSLQLFVYIYSKFCGHISSEKNKSMILLLYFLLFSFSLSKGKKEDSNNDEDQASYGYDEDFYDPEEYPDPDFNCTYPNTNKTEEGYCECIDGYTGDPYSKNGCYKCKQECVENANCEYPGICKCFYGYSGNGTEKCEIALPVMLEVSPNTSYPQGLIIINVSYKYEFGKPYQAYCRFGKSYVNHFSISDDIIQCMAPPRSPGKFEFSISVDEKHWSKEKIIFEYIDTPSPSRISIIPLLLIYIAFLVLISVLLYLFIGRRGKKLFEPTKEEKEPFLFDPERPKKKRSSKTRKRGL